MRERGVGDDEEGGGDESESTNNQRNRMQGCCFGNFLMHSLLRSVVCLLFTYSLLDCWTVRLLGIAGHLLGESQPSTNDNTSTTTHDTGSRLTVMALRQSV